MDSTSFQYISLLPCIPQTLGETTSMYVPSTRPSLINLVNTTTPCPQRGRALLSLNRAKSLLGTCSDRFPHICARHGLNHMHTVVEGCSLSEAVDVADTDSFISRPGKNRPRQGTEQPTYSYVCPSSARLSTWLTDRLRGRRLNLRLPSRRPLRDGPGAGPKESWPTPRPEPAEQRRADGPRATSHIWEPALSS